MFFSTLFPCLIKTNVPMAHSLIPLLQTYSEQYVWMNIAIHIVSAPKYHDNIVL